MSIASFVGLIAILALVAWGVHEWMAKAKAGRKEAERQRVQQDEERRDAQRQREAEIARRYANERPAKPPRGAHNDQGAPLTSHGNRVRPQPAVSKPASRSDSSSHSSHRRNADDGYNPAVQSMLHTQTHSHSPSPSHTESHSPSHSSSHCHSGGSSHSHSSHSSDSGSCSGGGDSGGGGGGGD